jgi:hypothetical protein
VKPKVTVCGPSAARQVVSVVTALPPWLVPGPAGTGHVLGTPPSGVATGSVGLHWQSVTSETNVEAIQKVRMRFLFSGGTDGHCGPTHARMSDHVSSRRDRHRAKRSRPSRFRGTVDIVSAPDQGTRVTVRVPVKGKLP